MDEQTTTPPVTNTSSSMSLQDEKTWLMIAHGSVLAGFIVPFGNIIAPLVVWLMKKETMPRAANQAREALNFQISVSIYAFVGFLLTFLLIGIPLLFVLGITVLVLVIKAIIDASNNKDTRFPATLRLVK